ncbi:MAG TPA: hypothetical protein VL551_08890 [Actinospica sp.]|nr:hypothetical protein [Actinospica sp.]
MIDTDDSDEQLRRLESQLNALTGPARTQHLLALGQATMMKYWRVGTGSNLALPYLGKAIDVLTEARGHMRPEDPNQNMAALLLGHAYTARGLLHEGPPADIGRGIEMLEEGLAATGLNPPQADIARILLGQLYLRRAMLGMQAPDAAMAMLRSGTDPRMLADLDRCIALQHEVIAHDRARELTEGARMMLTLAEGLRDLFGAFNTLGGGGMDMNRLMRLMTQMQESLSGLKQAADMSSRMMPTLAAQPIFDTESTTRMPPTERPVAVVRGVEPESKDGASQPSREPRARPARRADATGMRKDLIALLPDPADPLGCMTALLSDADTAPPTWLDRYLALAAGVVEAAQPPTAVDHLLLSAGLLLRARRDDDGWGVTGSDTAADDDGQAGLEAFLDAARAEQLDLDADLPGLLRLCPLLPAQAMAALGERLRPLTEDLRALGYDTLIFPETAGTSRWNTRTERFESARDLTQENAAVVLGAAPTAVRGPLAVSHLASFAQFSILRHRKSPPAAQDPVFLTDPRGDREWAQVEAMLLRRSFYPRSTGLGRLIEDCDGPGTPHEVRTRLAGASLLQLGCGVTADGALELADGAVLHPAEFAENAGGLAILPPGCFNPLADLLIDAGFAGVVGWHGQPSPDAAALLTYVLHWQLAEQGRTAAQAVGRTRRWGADPEPEILPPMLAARAAAIGPIPAADLDTLVYRGR